MEVPKLLYMLYDPLQGVFCYCKQKKQKTLQFNLPQKR